MSITVDSLAPCSWAVSGAWRSQSSCYHDKDSIPQQCSNVKHSWSACQHLYNCQWEQAGSNLCLSVACCSSSVRMLFLCPCQGTLALALSECPA